MVRKITLSSCCLNQWSLDFEGNYTRIVKSFEKAHERGSSYRLGPELEIPGYGCGDHFYEGDTMQHCFEVLAKLLEREESKTMICDVGMPILHKNVRYNCRVIFMYKNILLIRPKMAMANTSVFREHRWFCPWTKHQTVEEFTLPKILRNVTGQTRVPIGDGLLQTLDTCIGSEICADMWAPNASHIFQSLDGCEIITNGSGCLLEIGGLENRLSIIKAASDRCGVVYMFSTLIGCDGDRTYCDGTPIIAMNGEILAQGAQFSLNGIEVITATVDLDDLRTHRAKITAVAYQGSFSIPYPRVYLDFSVSLDDEKLLLTPKCSQPIQTRFLTPEEEISLGPAVWLWDNLRRSSMSGFFLALDGQVDSSSVACFVYSMCVQVQKAVESDNQHVLDELRRIVKKPEFTPKNAKEICQELLTTCFLADENSSDDTRSFVSKLSKSIGSHHHDTININSIVEACLTVGSTIFPNHGKSPEDTAVRNLRDRVRMLMTYLLAHLSMWARNKQGSGLLVLGSSNTDDALIGNIVRYGNSSGDLNPIGGISREHLHSFIKYATDEFNLPVLKNIPDSPNYCAIEGIPYSEISLLGKLRKVAMCGPYSMFYKLMDIWNGIYSISQIAGKVKAFFHSYGVNRHKVTTLPPSCNAESYNPDDSGLDIRPFSLPSLTWQYRKIDEAVKILEDEQNKDE
uniref:glutamine-dependent NAD(+) synthetase-like n=1 Tax=Styela clava TaxID=7725 RepID=UPI001939A4DE|nr:glutamine-dependent NAD(+) synthetase-like [Styela clava]